jgi:hypothetical protein
MAEPGIKPGASLLIVRNSDHHAARLIVSMDVGDFFLRQYISRILNLTTHSHLVYSERTGGAIPLLPYTWCV